MRQAQTITIEAPPHALEGALTLPPAARAIVLFAHGSGSSRFSPRNRFVAEALHREGLATLLFDLLTRDEEAEESRRHRFDIGLLARRLIVALDWVASGAGTRELRAGLFGASTGAAAALVAAAERPSRVGAVVSRGGRPDLAGEALPRVTAPTLLLVGGNDRQVLELNRSALARLGGPRQLVVVPGASHLFEEPGALEEVARQAAAWFALQLASAPVLDGGR
jgi:pimeloyl-ACP methyl ester carboxylesterase